MFLTALTLSVLAQPTAPLPEPIPSTATVAADRQTIKLASLVPDGSIWAKSLRSMGEDWKKATDGRVRLRLYPGGVAGDEPDVVRKMRIGQLGAATLTISGLGEISDAFRVFEVPGFFANNEEALHVLEKLTPILRDALSEEGFELVHWGHTGWVHIFSTSPIRSLDDLRQQKMFVWGSDNRMVDWWKQNGYRPVALAATDLLPSLQTGLIEAFPSPPLSALGLQWFRSAPYMMETGIMPFFGATVVTKKVWAKLSEEDRAALRKVGAEVEAELFREVPKQEAEGIAEMKKRGLNVVSLGSNETEFRKLAESFAKHMRGNIVPAEVLDQGRALRDAWRAKSAADG